MTYKKAWCLFVLFFLIGIASAGLEIKSVNGNISEGETFIGLIEVDFRDDLRKQDIQVLEGRRLVAFEKDVFRVGNKTFFYVVFPKSGEFKILVDTFLYYENGSLKQGKLEKNIFVSSSDGRVLTIKPGVVKGSELFIRLVNSGQEDLSASVQGNSYNVSINSFQRVDINPEDSFFYLDVGSYRSFSVPIIFLNLSEQEVQQNNETNLTEVNKTENNFSLQVFPREISKNLFLNESFIFEILLTNTMNESLEIQVVHSLDNLNSTKEIIVESNQEKIVEFSFNAFQRGSFSDEIIFYFDDKNESVSLDFSVFEDEQEINESFQEEDSISCEDLGGEVCPTNYYCSGEDRRERFVGSDFCCFDGRCVSMFGENGERGSGINNFIIGLVSFIIVGLVGYQIFKRFKGVKASPRF